jgi:hypothetical protein
MDYIGYDEMRASIADSAGRSKAEVRRVWIAGEENPEDRLGADEHAYQLLRWLQPTNFRWSRRTGK